jgi:pyridoxine kinase
MGDVGRGFYVKPDIPEMFKNELVPLADIVTPNQFELEALTGLETRDIDSARRAVNMLHEKGPGVVLVTSYRSGLLNLGEIGMLASDKTGLYLISTPELPAGNNNPAPRSDRTEVPLCLAGSGDITAAVFLSRYLETGDIKKTLELCTASVFGILEASLGMAGNSAGVPEMRIIEAQKEIVSPSRFFEACKLW